MQLNNSLKSSNKRGTINSFQTVQQIEDYMLQQDRSRDDHYTLDRVKQALQLLDSPHLKYKVVHIGGTSGKGSTCNMMASILKANHKKVGLFTSPAIVSSLERIQINGRSVTETSFVKLVNKIWPKIVELHLTYFEFFTVMALYLFADRKVDYAVIEVGMGGRLDATNAVESVVAVVTNVGLDHTEQLGRTKAKIAKEKGAIIKSGSIGITGSSYVKNARFIDVTKAVISSTTLAGNIFTYKKLRDVQLKLIGEYQVGNAVIAIEAAQALNIPEVAIRRGLETAKNAGRFEIISMQPMMIVDGAHNPDKMWAFIKSLRKIVEIDDYNKIVVLFALKFNKDIKATLKPLLTIVDTLIITTFSKGTDMKKIASVVRELSPHVKIIIRKDSRDAYSYYRKIVKSEDLGIITGSLYLIGDLVKQGLLKG
ncbi:MAG: folylpolyglutamate synthase/dihydrofolate synthase family protein [bacterium]|nr:folylpolyglutamate synthase/dihydrofolate synthase family protein [bacterium]